MGDALEVIQEVDQVQGLPEVDHLTPVLYEVVSVGSRDVPRRRSSL